MQLCGAIALNLYASLLFTSKSSKGIFRYCNLVPCMSVMSFSCRVITWQASTEEEKLSGLRPLACDRQKTASLWLLSLIGAHYCQAMHCSFGRQDWCQWHWHRHLKLLENFHEYGSLYIQCLRQTNELCTTTAAGSLQPHLALFVCHLCAYSVA